MDPTKIKFGDRIQKMYKYVLYSVWSIFCTLKAMNFQNTPENFEVIHEIMHSGNRNSV
jgi:hypothetical protein